MDASELQKIIDQLLGTKTPLAEALPKMPLASRLGVEYQLDEAEVVQCADCGVWNRHAYSDTNTLCEECRKVDGKPWR